MLLIPAIDLRQGRCVRLYQGDFDAETRYEAQPQELLLRYRSLGASWLHIVDLDGARDGLPTNRAIIVALAAHGAPRLQVGGGVRTAQAVADLVEVGIERVVVGSMAIDRPEEVSRWLQRFGAERLCLAFDVRMDRSGTPRVRTRGWTADSAVSLWDAIARFCGSALKHVLCTDIERDGTLRGPNVDLYREAVTRYPGLTWQASGGVRNTADLAALAQVGVAAAVSGKALLDGQLTCEELRSFLPDASFPASTFATARS